jgi:predicted dehydrogenase
MQIFRDQHARGRQNFLATGFNRRDFLRATAAVPAVAALGYGYWTVNHRPVKAAIVGTGNEGVQAMIDQSPPGFLEYVAYHDIRPSQITRGRKAFLSLYGSDAGRKVRFYDDWKKLLEDKDVEAVVIATPLWTHAKLTIDALEAGKHVLCEKLMAHNITDAKRMVRAAEKAGKILSIGHQRHYSTLYADAAETIRSGTLGDIRHIRALWHRNNARPVLAADGKPTGEYQDSWRPAVPSEDAGVDFKLHGYQSLEELIRWRLFNRTGGGLMAELGSHQLDACGIFIHAASGLKEKPLPLSVTGAGGKDFFRDNRECADHVYCLFEFPGKGFLPNRDSRDNDVVTVSYSSINTNAMEGYGEIVMGTRGSMLIMQEASVAIYEENDPLKGDRDNAKKRWAEKQRAATGAKGVEVAVKPAGGGAATMYSAASLGMAQEAKSVSGGMVSRGYREELEHFAWCIRHPDPLNKVRCDGRVALIDAVMAIVATQAVDAGARINFKPEWFDPASDAVPDAPASAKA